MKSKTPMNRIEYPTATGPLKPPSKFSTLKEARAPLEWLLAWGNRRKLQQVPPGDGRMVVLVPGYGADEWSMRPLKKFLQGLKYRVFDWGHGRNRGHVSQDTGLLADTVSRLVAQHSGQAVTLIGWSLGGVLAREVARLHPTWVDQIITMGTPLLGGPKYTVVAHKYARSMDMDLDAYEAEIHAINSQGISQPLTVIYSKSDGVVGWRASVDTYNEQAKNIEVSCSHLGMGVHAQVWQIIAESLATKRPDQAVNETAGVTA
ncbi:alpha/beta fold hydrolase [Marinicella meishanensis]|uniref:alpha/beta fold hydrolase n=1 Tax=Marinicella meishanensis TaxID=2873263 RepID=UPI001CBC449F|nr:alpha/beta fold hydrolase [Marinicella sp. NBU2979]